MENLRKAIENEKKAKKFLENMQELKMTIDRLKSQSTAINRRVTLHIPTMLYYDYIRIRFLCTYGLV